MAELLEGAAAVVRQRPQIDASPPPASQGTPSPEKAPGARWFESGGGARLPADFFDEDIALEAVLDSSDDFNGGVRASLILSESPHREAQLAIEGTAVPAASSAQEALTPPRQVTPPPSEVASPGAGGATSRSFLSAQSVERTPTLQSATRVEFFSPATPSDYDTASPVVRDVEAEASPLREARASDWRPEDEAPATPHSFTVHRPEPMQQASVPRVTTLLMDPAASEPELHATPGPVVAASPDVEFVGAPSPLSCPRGPQVPWFRAPPDCEGAPQFIVHRTPPPASAMEGPQVTFGPAPTVTKQAKWAAQRAAEGFSAAVDGTSRPALREESPRRVPEKAHVMNVRQPWCTAAVTEPAAVDGAESQLQLAAPVESAAQVIEIDGFDKPVVLPAVQKSAPSTAPGWAADNDTAGGRILASETAALDDDPFLLNGLDTGAGLTDGEHHAEFDSALRSMVAGASRFVAVLRAPVGPASTSGGRGSNDPMLRAGALLRQLDDVASRREAQCRAPEEITLEDGDD